MVLPFSVWPATPKQSQAFAFAVPNVLIRPLYTAMFSRVSPKTTSCRKPSLMPQLGWPHLKTLTLPTYPELTSLMKGDENKHTPQCPLMGLAPDRMNK